MIFGHDDTALLLIDYQKGFCEPDGSMARQGRDIGALAAAAEAGNRLAAAARSRGCPVIWTRMVFASDYSDGGVLTTVLRPNLAKIGALARGSGDEELASICDVQPGDLVIDKPRFSSLIGTPLEVILRSAGIGSVVVAGVTTPMCVESTVRDLSQRDYAVTVVADACADFERERHEAALAAMAFGFAHVAECADILTQDKQAG